MIMHEKKALKTIWFDLAAMNTKEVRRKSFIFNL